MSSGGRERRMLPRSGASPGVPREQRTAALVLADEKQRTRIRNELHALRWRVLEAYSGAELLARLEDEPCAAAVLDSWLPDLEIGECLAELRALCPGIDAVTAAGAPLLDEPRRGHRHGELLHALRRAGEADAVPYPAAAAHREPSSFPGSPTAERVNAPWRPESGRDASVPPQLASPVPGSAFASDGTFVTDPVPELLGVSPAMTELRRRIGLVGRRRTPVLIYGQTGTGKECVARALHRLSRRTGRFIAVNCAAIPDALLESELFGHARGAFTGAVTARTGRIEAAAGGTLFLDEIGELPPAAQAKLLRFLEAGELQRVGETEPVRVETRVVAATHRRLGAMASAGTFRLDLLHRLAVFLIETPPLAGRPDDLDALIALRLHVLGADEDGSGPRHPKSLSPEARRRLHAHAWPGNVRELEHTLERAWILAGKGSVIDEACIDFGSALD